MLAAQQLASSIAWGAHGRRRAGAGDQFWQYRPARTGDAMRSIDWRMSARSDMQYVRETEWQVAQSLQLWVDHAPSVQFTSHTVTKYQRAAIMALALADLALRGGERVGALDAPFELQTGSRQLARLAHFYDDIATQSTSVPSASDLKPVATCAIFSDFLGDITEWDTFLDQAAQCDAGGVMVMVLDPQEAEFPFQGRSVFENVERDQTFETVLAQDLRGKYLARLNARQAELRALADQYGWQFHVHMTQNAPLPSLLWLHHALGRRP